MAKNDFQYSRWNSYTLQCGTIVTLISPGDCTLQCGMRLWNRDSEFTKWQHPAMWHVALESWHWIHRVAASCNVAGGCGMTCHLIRPNVCHIGSLHLVSISTTWPQSTCHSAPVSEILSKSVHPQQKKMTSCRFLRLWISAILDFRGPIMASLKSPRTTSYRSSIETIALNFLVFEKIAFFAFWRQTDLWTAPIHQATAAVASGGLINVCYPIKILSSVKNIFSERFSMYFVHSHPFNETFIVSGKSYCCNDTFTDVRFTSLLAKNI